VNEWQKKIDETMKLLDEEFGDIKTYEWKASICHFVNYYDNMEGKQLEEVGGGDLDGRTRRHYAYKHLFQG
jgi:hypothetical protein